MSRMPVSTYGVAPRERVPAKTPPRRGVAPAPGGHPMAQAHVPTIARAPREHAAGKPPNPRKPKLVRDVDGGELRDLFALFPDLPRPPRPSPRVRTRIARGRGRH